MIQRIFLQYWALWVVRITFSIRIHMIALLKPQLQPKDSAEILLPETASQAGNTEA